MLDHLRKLHSDVYVVYRMKMMEKYGIMEMECPDCKFQFLTTYSYEHHKKNRRCHVYKGKIVSTNNRPSFEAGDGESAWLKVNGLCAESIRPAKVYGPLILEIYGPTHESYSKAIRVKHFSS